MLRNTILFLFLLTFVSPTQGQTLSKEDKAFLLDKLFFPTPGIDFSYSFMTGNLVPSKKPDYATKDKNEKEIEKLQKKLKGTPEDASIYKEMSSLYEGIWQKEKGKEYRLKAIENYKELIAAKPDDLENYNEIAHLFLADANYQGAGETFQYLIQQKPDEYKYWAGMALLHLQIGRAEAYKEYCLKLIDLDETKVDGHFGIIFLEFLQNMQQVGGEGISNLEDVLPQKKLNELMEKYPKQVEFKTLNACMNLLGSFYKALANVKTAEDIINLKLSDEEAKEINELKTYFQRMPKEGYKDESFINYSLLVLTLLEKDLNATKKLYKRNDQISPYFLGTKTNAFLIASALQDYEFAKSVYEDKARLYQEPQDNLMIGKMEYKLKKYDKAEQKAKEQLKDNPKDVYANLAMAVLMMRKDNFVQAKAFLYEVETENKDERQAPYFTLICAVYHLMRDNREDAKKLLDATIALDPKDRDAIAIKERFFE